MSDYYHKAGDLAKFGNIAEYQKEMADQFFSYYGGYLKTAI
ncbi:hypothetical protein [Mucilaginibacter aurantiaciroseus]|nr:hypothetical protein [Mucilaginibacter aurantiaciroseus]